MKNKECGGIDFTEFPILKDSIYPTSLPSKNKFYIYRRLDGALYMYDHQGIETKIEGSGGGSITIVPTVVGSYTHYRLSETSDLTPLVWLDKPANGILPFTLSATAGLKTVYA